MLLSRLSRITLGRIETTRVSTMFYHLLCIGLITDCHDSVKFLNRLPMGVLEESLEIFRANIFSMADRKQIPTLIYKVLEKELQE